MRREEQHVPRAGVAQARLREVHAPAERPARRDVSMLQALRERATFLREFIAHPDQVGSVVPSSRALEQRLVRRAHLARARCVVELGPGTGGTTRAFLDAMPATSPLLAIELNADFAARLRREIRDPRLTVVHGSAEHIERYLAEHGLPAPDAVLSGIPFSTMSREVGDRIAAAVARALAPGGRFVAYQVTPRVAERTSPYLGQPRRELELINIPPMRVFTWTRSA